MESEVAIPPITETMGDLYLEITFQLSEMNIETEIQCLLDDDWEDNDNGDIEAKAERLEELLIRLEHSVNLPHENPTSVSLKSKKEMAIPSLRIHEHDIDSTSYLNVAGKFAYFLDVDMCAQPFPSLCWDLLKIKCGKGDFDFPFDNG